MADLIAEALQVGLLDLMLAARPETCGHDMEVPDTKLYSGGFFPFGAAVVSFPIHAARMLAPGAAISGCKEEKRLVMFKNNDSYLYFFILLP